jgi:hypothetical protein
LVPALVLVAIVIVLMGVSSRLDNHFANGGIKSLKLQTSQFLTPEEVYERYRKVIGLGRLRCSWAISHLSRTPPRWRTVNCRLIGIHPCNGERTHAYHRSPELISTKPSERSGS